MYEFDEGTSGAAEGPFLNWHARETLDGVIGSRSFSVRTEDGRADVTDKMKAGVAVDLDSLKTGWCYTTGTPGQSPEWQWNESPARMAPQPPDRGDDRWKKGFSIRVALGKDKAATWSQSGAGAWQGLAALMRAVREDGGEGETAILSFSGVDEVKFSKGGTSAPQFSMKKWAKRPPCLEVDLQAAAPVVAEDATDAFGDDEF
tara:strand:+ start:2583 stop:3191 length:609 start_codon:yes stop_codon:yes gene_type:complete